MESFVLSQLAPQLIQKLQLVVNRGEIIFEFLECALEIRQSYHLFSTGRSAGLSFNMLASNSHGGKYPKLE
jgi:hypothetical protein